MGAFGERMQKERQLRGVTLEEISVVTKIGTRALKALEEEDFEKLPGGIFNKGFVRAYARYLGIDPDEAVSDYLAALEQRNRATAIDATGAVAQPARETVPDFYFVEQPEPSRKSLPITAIVVLAAIVLGGWWMWSSRSTLQPLLSEIFAKQRSAQQISIAKNSEANSSATPASQPQQPPPSPAATAPDDHPQIPGRAPVLAEVSPSLLSPAAKAAEERAEAAAKAQSQKSETISTMVTTVPSGTGFTVHLRAVQDSWVTVTADGKSVSAGLLAAGDERSVRAGNKIVVHLGNAGGVQLAFNGKDLPAAGEPGEVRTLAFGPNGRVPYNPPTPAPAVQAPGPAANPANPQ